MLEAASRAGRIDIFKRLLSYAEKVFDLSSAIARITDTRQRPQIPATVVARSALAMFLCRLGSLNSLEQLRDSKSLREYLDADLPSADSIGRIFDLIDSDTLRSVNHRIYNCLKRNKMLQPPSHGLVALVVDGHESHASYRRHCDGCLERKKTIADKECIQYYHRNVTAQLVFRDSRFLLDAESQSRGEGELTAGIRLLERVLRDYPKAFQVVVADALYAKSNFFNEALAHNKDTIAVLKDDRRELLKDAESTFSNQPSTCNFTRKGINIECWDADNFQTWPQVVKSVRVVRTLESKNPIKRQLSGEPEDQPATSWTWVTTLSPKRACSQTVVEIGHSRWCVENEGFNELANHWHANHVYKHAPTAIQNFWIMSMIAYNIFRVFFLRNLRSVVRKGKSMLHFARRIRSELYRSLDGFSGLPP